MQLVLRNRFGQTTNGASTLAWQQTATGAWVLLVSAGTSLWVSPVAIHGSTSLELKLRSSLSFLLALLSSSQARIRVDRQAPNTKKAHCNAVGFRIGCLAVSYSHMGSPTLPSALTRFTSEFGMGSGGTTLPLPPSKFCISMLEKVSLLDTIVIRYVLIS